MLKSKMWTIVLILAAFAAAPVATANDVAAGFRVRALHCEFHLPNDYEVLPDGNGGIEFHGPASESPFASARLVMTTESEAGDGREIEVQRRGHLTISRRTYALVGENSPGLTFVVIHAFSDELHLMGGAVSLTDSIVSECLTTASPVALQAAQHRRQGCGGTLSREDVNLLMRTFRSQVVFRGGTQIGWRIGGNSDKTILQPLGLRTGDLVTHICGASVAEIFEIKGDVCCTSSVKSAVPVTIDWGGTSIQFAVSQPIHRALKTEMTDDK